MEAFLLLPQLIVNSVLSLPEGVKKFSFLQGPLGKPCQTLRKTHLILRSASLIWRPKLGCGKSQAHL